jgi:hypothetical protein
MTSVVEDERERKIRRWEIREKERVVGVIMQTGALHVRLKSAARQTDDARRSRAARLKILIYQSALFHSAINVAN